MSENKNSFFFLTLSMRESEDTKAYREKLNDSCDLVFGSLGVINHIYKFTNNENNEIIYFFKTENRKRRGEVVKFCNKLLPTTQTYDTGGLTRVSFFGEIERIKKNKNYTLVNLPESNSFFHYDGRDIKIFNDRKKWHPWQKELYDKIWDSNGSFKEPDPRHIISIVDKKGNSGKSSFFKWLVYRNPNSIGRLGYGSASQLRSCAINIGQKNLYIIDLSRARSRTDREEDLLSVLEDLKSGFITNAMYGSGKSLLIPPPHIIVSSNYFMDYSMLSSDRWETYTINQQKELKPVRLKLLKSLQAKRKIPKKFQKSLE